MQPQKKLTIPLLGLSAGLIENATSQSLDASHVLWCRDGQSCYDSQVMKHSSSRPVERDHSLPSNFDFCDMMYRFLRCGICLLCDRRTGAT
ncbi:hypothetical protein BDR03DRAFT_950359 [Suillus americanus]|nr:hypothetical protein BDR03DRAFT_950359 [Suillus americanus]